jgi:FKBP-type peptidyl-prolyl cis-trans isomerase FkpA
MSSVTQVPLRPLKRGALAKLWLGLLLLIAAALLLAWAGAGQTGGVRVKTLAPGSGPTITADDGVLIEYEGKLDDGTVFDSSAGRGPAFFPVGGVVPGFSQALQKMQKGGRYEFTLPSDLAYGDTPPAARSRPAPTCTSPFRCWKLRRWRTSCAARRAPARAVSPGSEPPPLSPPGGSG